MNIITKRSTYFPHVICLFIVLFAIISCKNEGNHKKPNSTVGTSKTETEAENQNISPIQTGTHPDSPDFITEIEQSTSIIRVEAVEMGTFQRMGSSGGHYYQNFRVLETICGEKLSGEVRLIDRIFLMRSDLWRGESIKAGTKKDSKVIAFIRKDDYDSRVKNNDEQKQYSIVLMMVKGKSNLNNFSFSEFNPMEFKRSYILLNDRNKKKLNMAIKDKKDCKKLK